MFLHLSVILFTGICLLPACITGHMTSGVCPHWGSASWGVGESASWGGLPPGGGGGLPPGRGSVSWQGDLPPGEGSALMPPGKRSASWWVVCLLARGSVSWRGRICLLAGGLPPGGLVGWFASRQTPLPPAPLPHPRYGQPMGGTHPTGMHTSFFDLFCGRWPFSLSLALSFGVNRISVC